MSLSAETWSTELLAFEDSSSTPTRTKSKSKKSSKKSSSTSSQKSQSVSSSSVSTPAWLPGKYVHPRLDTIFLEYIYEVYEIGKDGYMRYGESTSKNATPNNPRFKYYVKGDVLYSADDNKPLLKLNSASKTVTMYNDSDRVFKKIN